MLASTFYSQVLAPEGDLQTLEDALRTKRHDPNANLLNKATPLHMGAALGSGEGVKLLLRYDAEPLSFDQFNRSPLALACSHGHAGIVEQLMAALQPRFVRALLRTVDSRGWTPVHHAAYSGDEGVLGAILTAVADVCAGNTAVCFGPPEQPKSPLHVAASKGAARACTLLACAPGAPPIDMKGGGGQTALILAAIEGHDEAVAALLAARADVHARDDEGMTALHWAAIMEHEPVCSALLHAGADPSTVDTGGEGFTLPTGMEIDMLTSGETVGDGEAALLGHKPELTVALVLRAHTPNTVLISLHPRPDGR